MSRLLTTREAAERLAISTRTVQRLQERGTLPPVRLPGLRLVRFDPNDVESLARNGAARAERESMRAEGGAATAPCPAVAARPIHDEGDEHDG